MDFQTFINTLFHGDRKTKLLLWSSIACIFAGLVFVAVFVFTLSPGWILGTVISFLMPFLILKDYRLFEPESDKPVSAKTEEQKKRDAAIMEDIRRDAALVGDLPKKKENTGPEPGKRSGSAEKEKKVGKSEPALRSKSVQKPKSDKNSKSVKAAADTKEPKDGKEDADTKSGKKPRKKLFGNKKERTENIEKPENDREKLRKVKEKTDKKRKDASENRGKPDEDRERSGEDSPKRSSKPAGTSEGPEPKQQKVREEKGKRTEGDPEEKHFAESSDQVQQKAGKATDNKADKNSPENSSETVKSSAKTGIQKEGSTSGHNLIDSDKSELKKLMVKYKVKKEHRPVIIDSSEHYGIENCPAYMWVARGKVHFLLMEETPREIVMDYARCTSISYTVREGEPATEYSPIRTNRALLELFGSCIPAYHDEYVGRRRTSFKNIYVVGSDILLTNTSARAAFDLLKASFVLPDKYSLPGLKGSFSKEAYQTKVLWTDGVINTSEFKTRTKNLLQKMAKANISPLEYDSNLREMLYNQLITKEVADYYADPHQQKRKK